MSRQSESIAQSLAQAALGNQDLAVSPTESLAGSSGVETFWLGCKRRVAECWVMGNNIPVRRGTWCTRFSSGLWPSRRNMWSLCSSNSSSLRFVTLYRSAVELADMDLEANLEKLKPEATRKQHQSSLVGQMFFLKGDWDGLGTPYLILYSFLYSLSTFLLPLLFFWSMGSRPDVVLSTSATPLLQTTESLSFALLLLDPAT